MSNAYLEAMGIDVWVRRDRPAPAADNAPALESTTATESPVMPDAAPAPVVLLDFGDLWLMVDEPLADQQRLLTDIAAAAGCERASATVAGMVDRDAEQAPARILAIGAAAGQKAAGLAPARQLISLEALPLSGGAKRELWQKLQGWRR